MKKFLLILVTFFWASITNAQNWQFKDVSGRKILFIEGRKFTGDRTQVWKLEKNLAIQPISTELLILSTVGSTTTDVWQYFLVRLIDGQWEYITSFSGYVVPIVTLTDTEFTAFQHDAESEKKWSYKIVSETNANQRRWQLVEIK